jgi:ribosomal protein L37AE/L43A
MRESKTNRSNSRKVVTVPLVPLQRGDFGQYLPELPENPLKPRYSRRSIKAMLAAEDRPNAIVLCPVCRSRNLLQKTHFFWLWNCWRFVCNECSTTLQQAGDKYRLTQVFDTGNPTWRKYGQRTLYSREWANIANGGLSDDEIIANLANRPAAPDR